MRNGPLGIVGGNADAITGNGFRELAWTDKNRLSAVFHTAVGLRRWIPCGWKTGVQHERRETKA